MAFSADDFQMVEDHIAQGERHVTRQEELITWLRERGHQTEMAEQLLAEFEATLLQHRAHRDLMLHEITADPFSPRPPASVPPKGNRSPAKG